jgi:Xaa-Pro aminopeptidase
VETRDARFGKWIRETYPNQSYELSAPIMHKIRAVKDDIEIAHIQKACDLTESAFRKTWCHGI